MSKSSNAAAYGFAGGVISTGEKTFVERLTEYQRRINPAFDPRIYHSPLAGSGTSKPGDSVRGKKRRRAVA